MNRQLEALGALHVSTAPTPDEVWASLSSYHVDALYPEVSARLARSMNALDGDHAPTAAVALGERGSGKTHLLGWTRQEIQARGGFFFYIKLVTGCDFWESATGSLVDGLYRKDDGGQEQLVYLLAELSRLSELDEATRAAITGERALTRTHLDAFVHGIRGLDRQVGNEAADTARALALIASSGEAVEIGKAYLALNDEDLGQRAAWGLSSRQRPAQLVLRDLTRIFALVGPLVFAFDQLDNLVSASEASLASAASGESRAVIRLSNDIAAGLMDMREEARRTLMVIACQPDTWRKISHAAILSALDRFTVLPTLGEIRDEATAAAIIGNRFRAGYASVEFTPPYQTWPIRPEALAGVPHRYTPRRLLIRVAEHIANCLESGAVTELLSLAPGSRANISPRTVPATELAVLTEEFSKLRAAADDIGPLDKANEDGTIPALLGAGLRCLIKELGGDESRFVVETEFGGKAALHARLRYILDDATENELHWSFRAIATDNARAAQTRMHNAVVEAGLETGLPSRSLFLLRNTTYPGGTKTDEIKADFLARGGLALPIGAADLRTFAALHTMLDSHRSGLDVWLRQQHPAARTEVFAAIVSDLQPYLGAPTENDDIAVGTADADAEGLMEGDLDERGAVGAPEIYPGGSHVILGATTRGGRPFTVAIEQFRKHAVVIGAAGSGKTVLVKRIVEQCAMRGISAIVLDPNDDLGRLGDPWPDAPRGWTDTHQGEAQRYFAETEVVVWTPGLNRGRPLSFHPLPDFGPVLGDEDDFKRLLGATIAALAPQAGIGKTGGRATQQLGVLSRALERYAREGGRNLAGLIEMLGDAPADIVNTRTRKLAEQMADTLEAALDTDPLFGESGTPVDPGVLLTPSAGKSARISVISFVGLSREGSARFVSRLQGALFSWFRANPTNDRPLGGLLVMDEAQNFVPSGASTPSTDSTVEIIRQIRKYGLGVVLASQAPKGINNQALGNTANQFIGRLTAQTQLEAAQMMAQSRNADLKDLGSLPMGTFYSAGEGTSFSKIQVPICLSHHTGPLREDEVVERAHRNG
ncbi:ATP-binding protein [Hamadaea tsunoensis]|uniref:ATP-binding protein n=1 Tax=Hamadaea tsunoensis TaxID=53368 RepID=UPI000419D94B|nr:ATP-binding protein [Hamadaea tsunoensis]